MCFVPLPLQRLWEEGGWEMRSRPDFNDAGMTNQKRCVLISSRVEERGCSRTIRGLMGWGVGGVGKGVKTEGELRLSLCLKEVGY